MTTITPSRPQRQTDRRGRFQVWAIAGCMLFAVVMKTLPYLLPRLGIELDPTDSLSYLWNLSPLLPLALVLGATCSARTAILLASVTWLVGDLGIWAASGVFEYAFYKGMPIVFLSMWFVVAVGLLAGQRSRASSIVPRLMVNVGCGVVGAVGFFLITNFFVWLFGNEAMYPLTFGGLIECYAMAIPFSRGSLVSMLVYVPVFTVLIPTLAGQSAVESEEVVAQRAI